MQKSIGSASRTPIVVRDRAILEGVDAATEQDLVAVLLDRGGQPSDAWPAAARLLTACGGLAGLSRFRAGGLAKQGGISEDQAVRVLAALELGRRAGLSGQRAVQGRALTARAVFEWARPRLGGLEHEEIWVLCVDARTRLRSTWMVGRGGLHGCAVLPRDILVPVVREAAAAFVLVHNHPSGDPTPSREDVRFTEALAHAALALTIPLLDHVVVARDAYRSLLDEGQLRAPG